MLGPVEILGEVDSTNRVLLERARAGAPHGAVLVADHQTAGKGRLGRRWEAAPGAALLVSVLLRPEISPADAHLLTFAAGLAAVEACRVVAGIETSLKWPNDVVVVVEGETRKLAGILAESVVDGDALAAVVVGMGMNLISRRLIEGAVGMDELAGRAIDRTELLARWLERLDASLANLQEVQLLERYRAASATIGREVRVQVADRSFTGRALDVDTAGGLIVETGGRRVAVTAGDVFHLREVSQRTRPGTLS